MNEKQPPVNLAIARERKEETRLADELEKGLHAAAIPLKTYMQHVYNKHGITFSWDYLGPDESGVNFVLENVQIWRRLR